MHATCLALCETETSLPNFSCMPTLQWLDFSPTEREDVLALLESQKDKSTVDELGLGLVRDAISDHLFPGLSTIQTRARYFLYVAWLLRDLERGNVHEDRLALTLRQREVALINALLATDGRDDAERHVGLIGRESRDTTKRLPSTIYWGGVRRFGLYQGTGSLQEYLSDLPALRKQRHRRKANAEDGEGNDGDANAVTWDPGLPEADDGFLTETTFALTRTEARYLNERVLGIRTASRNICLLQWMVRHLDAVTVHSLDAPWSLLDESDRWPTLPASLRTELIHAHHFSLCTRVLTAGYFRLLAARRRDLELALYDELLADTLSGLSAHAQALSDWHADLPSFWRWIAQVNPRLQRDRPFIEEWLQMLSAQNFSLADPARLIDTQVERWMQLRERRLKGTLARMGNPPVLQRWNAPAWVGLTDYRWTTARNIVSDILTGLGRTGASLHAGS